MLFPLFNRFNSLGLLTEQTMNSALEILKLLALNVVDRNKIHTDLHVHAWLRLLFNQIYL